MASFKALCLAGVASLVATATAFAADLPLPAPPPVYIAPPPPVIGGNWYLRGDVGIAIADLRTSPSTFAYNVPDVRYEEHSLDDSAFIDGGVGYRFNQYFRVDATGEYRAAAQYSAIESYNQGYYSRPRTPARGYDAYRGSVRVVDGLVNGYVDAGTWYGITPFIGGGVGVANINSGSVIDNGEGGGLGYSYGKSTTNFAFAAMAGLDFQVTRNLVFEIGYRYFNAGSYSSGASPARTNTRARTRYSTTSIPRTTSESACATSFPISCRSRRRRSWSASTELIRVRSNRRAGPRGPLFFAAVVRVGKLPSFAGAAVPVPYG